MKKAKNATPVQPTLTRWCDGLIPEMGNLLIVWINEETQELRIPLNQVLSLVELLSLPQMLKNGRSYQREKRKFQSFHKHD